MASCHNWNVPCEDNEVKWATMEVATQDMQKKLGGKNNDITHSANNVTYNPQPKTMCLIV